MNFKRAFTFIFEDPDWFSKLIGPILCNLIPVVGSFVFLGYMLNVARNVANGDSLPLPRLEFGKQASQGFRWFLVSFVYSLPILIFAGLAAGIGGFGASQEGAIQIIAILISIIFGILAFLIGLIIVILSQLAYTKFAVEDRFSAAFAFKDLFGMLRSNFKAWLMVFGGVLIAGFIAPLGAIILVIGRIVTGVYGQLLVAHLSGQAYSLSQNN